MCKLDIEKAYDHVSWNLEHFVLFTGEDGLWGLMEKLGKGLCHYCSLLSLG